MPLPFRQETRATLRRRVGALVAPETFAAGQVLAATGTTVTLQVVKRYPNGHFKGRIGHVTSGTGAGQSFTVTDSASGTGVLTVTPAFDTPPDATSQVEIWPEGIEPERVNDALNAAVLEASGLVAIRADQTSPTLDAGRKVITPPATWVYVLDVLYQDDSGSWRKYYPSRFEDYLIEQDLGFTCLNGTIQLSHPIPANVSGANILLRGYRLPVELTSDATLAEVPADFLVYTAALALESGRVAGPLLDPEQHATRSSAWLRSSLVARSKLGTDWEGAVLKLRP